MRRLKISKREGDVLSGADALKMIRFVAFGGYEPTPRLIIHRAPLLVAAAIATLVIGISSYWGGIRSAEIGAENGPAPVFGELDSMPVGQSAREQEPAAAPSFSGPDHSAGTTGLPAKMQPPAAVGRGAVRDGPSTVFGEVNSMPIRQGAAEPKSPVVSPTPDSDRNAGGVGQTAKMRPPAAIGQRAVRGAEPSKASGASTPGASAAATGLKQASASRPAARAGEMVRIGRFNSDEEAQKAWSNLSKAWPDARTLSVVPVRIKSLRDGKTYYRMQVITTSRSHSEILCKRVHDLDQSCTVIGAEEYGAEGPF